VAGRIGVPVIGMGGVTCGAHARDVLAAGATLVAVGTESFRDPRAGSRIARELKSLQNAGSPSSGLRESEPQVQVDMDSADSR
jgi:dihydroorotate dehydrogenase (NAD+) catalytic subunit